MKKIIDHCLDHQGACAGIICWHALLCNKAGNGNMNQKRFTKMQLDKFRKKRPQVQYIHYKYQLILSTFALFKKAHLELL